LLGHDSHRHAIAYFSELIPGWLQASKAAQLNGARTWPANSAPGQLTLAAR